MSKMRKVGVLIGLGAFIVASWSLLGMFGGTPAIPPPPEIKSHDEKVIGGPGTPALLTVESERTESEHVSKVIRSNFRFNSIAPHWKETGANESNRIVEIRASDNNHDWSPWYEVEAVGSLKDNDPHPDRTFAESPIFVDGNYFQVRTKLTKASVDQSAPVLTDMLVTYIDSTKSSPSSMGDIVSNLFTKKAAAADRGPSVISRAQWGSPDPYGKSMEGDAFWPTSYVPVKQFYVHHTVNANNSSDFAAVVRGIWQYHAITRGWGDIGYNYLIDSNGRVYEGRFGGDNVVGAHAFGFNSGSMGIALLGCFQTGSTCSGINGTSNIAPSARIMDMLSEVIAWKSTSYEIDPNTTQTVCDANGESCRELWTVAGHRDVGETSCPGDLTYQQLESIRQTAALKKSQNLWSYSAKQQSFSSIDLVEGEKNVTLSFKNTGTTTWTKSGFGRLILQTANPSNHQPFLVGSDWLDPVTPSDLDQASVAPGQVGTFTFKVNGSGLRNQTHFESFRLVSESNSEFHYFFSFYFTGPRYSYSIVSQSSSTGSFVLPQDGAAQFTLRVRNTGSVTWSNSTNPVRLATWSPSYRTSVFNPSDGSWISQARAAVLSEASVAPGQVGTFTFNVKAPQTEGFYVERFNLVAEGAAWFQDPWLEFDVRVGSFYKWQMVSQSSNKGFLLKPGESAQFTVVAKNIGNTSWSTTTNPVRFATWAPSYRTSVFNPNDSSWVNATRPAVLQDPDGTVAPGETGTFVFNVKAPDKPGFYVERFNLVAEGTAWFEDPWMEFDIHVGNFYKWQMVSQSSSTGSFTLPRNSTANFTMTARNIGNTTWSNTTNPVRLATWAPSYRTSVFNPSDGSWVNPYRAVTLQEASVEPGQVGTFVFSIKAPSTPGFYVERFNLVAEGAAWFDDPWMEFDIVVN